MLSLQLKDGEYLTIGDDIVIQVSSNAAIKLYVTAPKDKTILRGTVLERGGENRPDFLFAPRERSRKKVRRTLPEEPSEAVPTGRGGARKRA